MQTWKKNMVLTNKYKILPTSTFKKELKKITNYFKNKLKEPSLSKQFYTKVIAEINSLEYMPERYVKIPDFKNKTRNLRRLILDNYVIIYQVIIDTRASFYLTYFP